jgi:hypothetical protein
MTSLVAKTSTYPIKFTFLPFREHFPRPRKNRWRERERKTINHFQHFLPPALTTEIHLILWLRQGKKEKSAVEKKNERKKVSVAEENYLNDIRT